MAAPRKKATAAVPAVKRRKSEPAPIEVRFNFERSTKNTHRFAEDADPDEVVIGTLYIKKACIGDTPPDAITVTIQRTN